MTVADHHVYARRQDWVLLGRCETSDRRSTGATPDHLCHRAQAAQQDVRQGQNISRH